MNIICPIAELLHVRFIDAAMRNRGSPSATACYMANAWRSVFGRHFLSDQKYRLFLICPSGHLDRASVPPSTSVRRLVLRAVANFMHFRPNSTGLNDSVTLSNSGFMNGGEYSGSAHSKPSFTLHVRQQCLCNQAALQVGFTGASKFELEAEVAETAVDSSHHDACSDRPSRSCGPGQHHCG